MSLKTDLLSDELRQAFPHAGLHAMDCDCGRCRASADPARVRHDRAVRLQAAVLGAMIVALYAMALYLAPQIAAAFSVGPDHVQVDGGQG